MSRAASVLLPMSMLDDDAWDDLLSFIEERRVIPIVGPELLQVATERGPRLLYDWLAEKLAARNHDDKWQPFELASAFYVLALSDAQQRTALLREAAALVASLPAEMQQLFSARLWRERIAKAGRGAVSQGSGSTTGSDAG